MSREGPNKASRQTPVITVDGPSGSGKGTISARVAKILGWHLLDSGALYRLVGLAARRRGVPMTDAEMLTRLAGEVAKGFREETDAGAGGPLRLDGEDVAEAIRSEEAGAAASTVAAHAGVREALLAGQRAFRRPPGLVADGRDMGTTIFPGAELKIFLDATAEERARRRHKQLKGKGMDGSLGRLLEEIRERDRRDAERPVSPMRPAPDAKVIDTTDLGITEVVDRIVTAWRRASRD